MPIKIILLVSIFFMVSCSTPPKQRKLYPDVTLKKVADSKPRVVSYKTNFKHRKASTKRYSSRLNKIFKLYGPDAKKRIKDWEYTIIDHRRKSEMQKLYVTNHFINRLNFIDDKAHWRKNDYWATPLETLASSGGDCEDFAIAKYFTLKKLGMPEQCLTLNYVKVANYNKPHMVLVYQCFDADEPLVLDNLNPKLLSVKQRTDLTPVYSFNREGMWLTNNMGKKKRINKTSRLKLWDDVRMRIRQE
jgi:predicted transglutaminase-like cysteine proteinase